MAKKNKGTFSYIETQQALEAIATTATRESLPYELLRIFCGYGDAAIARVRDGRGNDAKDGKTVLIKKLFAYRPTETTLLGEEDVSDVIEALEKDASIAKKEPRLYITFDGQTLFAHDPKENDVYYNDITLLWKDFDFFKPLAGIEKFRNHEEAEADVKSAEMMAKIFDDISRYNDIRDAVQVHNLNIFMTRLLFCYFAEDTGLFPVANMFTDAIREDTKADGSDLKVFLESIFAIMSIEDKVVRAALPEHITRFPYVNGGLFKEYVPVPTLSRRTRTLMLKCGEYNWKEINPDIFGSMIQAVINPEVRSGMGVHYTSVPNIMKVIKPLFLDELTEEYTRIKDDVKKLRLMLLRLSKIKFFDPACGSGNFLIIAYKAIRELEIEIYERLRVLGHSELPIPNIQLQQFYGIEIDEYACDTAILSLWLAEHQMNVKFNERLGIQPSALPLRPSGHIICGNACRLDWNTVCPHTAEEEVYIMGNPPYLGSRNQDENHKADMDVVMSHIKQYRRLDYIANWFVKGANYIRGYCLSKLAFVSTNSITQGEQPIILWDTTLNEDLEIAFAYTTFKWTNNAKYNAGISVVIIGLQNKCNRKKILYTDGESHCIDTISPYLTNETYGAITKQTKPISPYFKEMRRGNMPNDKEFLRLNPVERDSILMEYPHAEKFIRLHVGADEFINAIERYCYWIDDMDYDEAMTIPPIKLAVDNVREYRINSKDKTLHIQAKRPHQFREFFECGTNALLVPIVSSEIRKYIPIGFVPDKTIVPNSAQVVYDADLLTFGVLTSLMHNLWVRKNAGRLENRFRYSIFLCYNTFPFPKINEEQKEKLSALAENILLTRENHTEMTLGEMYNPESMPLDLKLAHQAMDIAVEQCYRPEPFTSDEERLEYLFKLYEKMTKKK